MFGVIERVHLTIRLYISRVFCCTFARQVADGDIEALGHVMKTLREVREKQGEIELEPWSFPFWW